MKSLRNIFIAFALALSAGCGSVISSRPLPAAGPETASLPAISLDIESINTTEASKANNFDDYRRVLFDTLLKDSGGIVRDKPGPLRFSKIILRCHPPKPSTINNTGLVIAAILVPPLVFMRDYSEFNYIVDYEIVDRSGKVLLKRFLTSSVRGYAKCENTGELISKQGKFVAENSARMILADIRKHSEKIIAALKPGTQTPPPGNGKWTEIKGKITQAILDNNIKRAIELLTEAGKQGLGGKERSELLDEVVSKLSSEGQAFPKAEDYNYKDCWALVIGISKYKNDAPNGLRNLSFADDDAVDFRKVLLEKGWQDDHIKLLTDKNATKRNIEDALAGWLSKAGKDDLIVLFWSGHGYPDPGDMRKVYFACYDTVIQKPYTGWRMDRVIESISEKKPRNVVVFTDSCHAGKIVARGNDNDKGIAVKPYLEYMAGKGRIPPGWIYFAGADSDRKAIENSAWSNGVFSHCLIQGLKGAADFNKDGKVTMLELKAYMSSVMPEESLRVLGAARHPLILSNSADSAIWNLSLNLSK